MTTSPETSKIRSQSTTHKLTITAMLSAVAFALMFIEVPIPALIPSFVKMDISDLPELLGAFALGPVYGAAICLVKNLLHILIKGTSSGFVGELCNFLLGSFFVITAGAVYQKNKTRKGALIGSLIGAAVMAIMSVPLNYFITYPFYATLFGGMDLIIQAYQAILPSADSLLKCLLIFNMPFTLVKGLIDVVLTLLIYKSLSPILHK